MNLLIKRLCLNGIIEFLDETDDVPSMLSKMDVLVSANTLQEAFGRIIIEAQSSGVPCVATRVGGVVDIIEDGVTGFLCEPSSPQDMARKILLLYRDERLRNTMAKNARKSVEEKYALDKMMQSTLGVYEDCMKSFRILIIKISALGDVILSIPSIRAIRAKYPKATIKVLVGLESRDVLKNLPYIDEIIISDFKNRDRHLKGFMRIANILRNEDFDIVVDFQNNKKSHCLSFLSFAPIRYGYDNGKFSFLINRKVKDSGLPLDPVEHQTKVLHLVGTPGKIDKELKLTPSREERLWAKKFLKDNWVNPARPIISLNLESSSRWITKRWPIEYFVELSEKLAKEFLVRVIVTGQNPSDERNKKFQKSANCKPILSIGKTTLGQLMALIETSSLLVTSDSAPMHIASACGTPFIALFGPTDPRRHLPPAEDYKVIKKDMKCAPCYKATCSKGYTCMKAIKPDEVFDAVCELLNESITINNPH
jgi:lipopolysaccharide heptosyltransferase II